jgi:hypothetical protein
MNSVPQDRRGSRRLSVSIPIRACAHKSILPDRYAEIQNISETGAYFVTWSRFREGDCVDLSTNIETRDWTQSTEWRYSGHVLRVRALDSRSQTFGVAVRFNRNPNPERLLRPGERRSSQPQAAA